MNDDQGVKKKYRIVYDRKGCIGAVACTAVSDNWEMREDGKASIKGKTIKADKDEEIMIITEDELGQNKEAAEVCPVNVIHIYDEETGEKII